MTTRRTHTAAAAQARAARHLANEAMDALLGAQADLAACKPWETAARRQAQAAVVAAQAAVVAAQAAVVAAQATWAALRPAARPAPTLATLWGAP